MSECKLCAGTLLVRASSVSEFIEHNPGRPCPNCLTVLATEEIREVAREWYGSERWHTDQAGVYWTDVGATMATPWYSRLDDLGAHGPVVPAYLPAGHHPRRRTPGSSRRESGGAVPGGARMNATRRPGTWTCARPPRARRCATWR